MSQQEIGDHLGLSQQQVSAWLARLGLTVEAGLDAIRLAYIEALRAAAAGQAPSEERENYLRIRRQRAEFEYLRETGKLVSAEGVHTSARRAGRALGEAISNIGIRIGPQLAGVSDPGERARIWDRELGRVREAMAEQMQRMAGPEK